MDFALRYKTFSTNIKCAPNVKKNIYNLPMLSCNTLTRCVFKMAKKCVTTNIIAAGAYNRASLPCWSNLNPKDSFSPSAVTDICALSPLSLLARARCASHLRFSQSVTPRALLPPSPSGPCRINVTALLRTVRWKPDLSSFSTPATFCLFFCQVSEGNWP